MRILFLSDTHLGIDLPARPRVARRRRGEDFLASFERALAPALAGEVDVVLHGGDLLYRSRVPARLAEAALAPLRRLASTGVPVLLVPGNHERGRISHPLLALHPNLHVFDRPRTFTLAARGLRVAFVGFPYATQVRTHFAGLLAAARQGEVDADVRVLCLHHCIEGATCGPGDFTFRAGSEVIRAAELPRDVAVVLCGHIHRYQVLRPAGGPEVVYAGSVERTSFAEAGETKGVVALDLSPDGVAALEFRPLPARPMVVLRLSFRGVAPERFRSHLTQLLESTPPDAVVQLRPEAELPPGAASLLGAASLRQLSGARHVVVAAPAWARPR
ncbi:MAG TPA: metallophosphoesterase [Anaeromyxobacteraceae bacterium]|nr:metallophosphoesterase [Anaeromyxobacteraceae bacterium]